MDDLARYSRQVLLAPIGPEGQRRLLESRVTLIGCGALGTVLANTLARAGVGFLRIVDRDFIELDNLQRQVLFDEDDIAAGVPKAEAARRKLVRANSEIEVEAHVVDANSSNIETLCDRADLILDGADNFDVRFLVNDVAVKLGVPWVYGACVAAEGLVMPILPGRTPCLRCLWDEPPPPGASPTCDTAGVLSPVVGLVAGFQSLHALSILTGRIDRMCLDLLSIDGWTCRVRNVDVQSARDPAGCRCCGQRVFDHLLGQRGALTATLCGRHAVQIMPGGANAPVRVDFAALAARLAGQSAAIRYNEHMLKFVVDTIVVTVFPDGRAIIKGTDDPSAARSIYARFVGH